MDIRRKKALFQLGFIGGGSGGGEAAPQVPLTVDNTQVTVDNTNITADQTEYDEENED